MKQVVRHVPASSATEIVRGNGWEMRLGRWQDSPPEPLYPTRPLHAAAGSPFLMLPHARFDAAHPSVDVTISDPPYGERTHVNGRRGSGWKGVEEDNREISERAPKSFDPIDPADVAPWLVGLTKRWVFCFCEIEQIGDYYRATGDSWIRGGMAPKRNPVPQFSGDRPGTPGDCVAIMHRPGAKRWNGGGHAALYPWSAERRDRHHETQKDLVLMMKIVELYSEPGELVWDPYAGAATTGVAALRLERRFIGHELQPRYFKIACDRLRAEEQNLTLEEYRAGQRSLF